MCHTVKKGIVILAIGLCLFPVTPVCGLDDIEELVGNLLAIGYPISKEDVAALDKIAMRFDVRNRIDVLKKILSDRNAIHSIGQDSYFAKTEAICSALRLLDEHNLPETDSLIEALSRQGGWEKREKELLLYMAAKRDIDYASNVTNLLAALEEYRNDPEAYRASEITVGILDLCNNLSYLADIFSHTGDVRILTTLLHYASHSYGYPGEYLSRLFVDMFLQQPNVFVPQLAAMDEQTKNSIINSMVFGIWNNQQKANVLECIQNDLVLKTEAEKLVIDSMIKKINGRFPSEPAGGNAQATDESEKL